MTPDLILHYAPDNASLCVRLLLETMRLPYQTKLVDRTVQAQKSDAYLRLNPNGLIPTLETANGPIYETGAILLWLADQRPGSVMPAPDDPARASALRQLFWVSNTLHPTLRMLFYPEQYTDDDQHALQIKTRQRLTVCYDQLDNDNCVEIPTIACYIAPLLRWSALYGRDTTWFDLSKWKYLKAFAHRFEATAPVITASQAEGLGPLPFSDPQRPNPPEGSPT